ERRLRVAGVDEPAQRPDGLLEGLARGDDIAGTQCLAAEPANGERVFLELSGNLLSAQTIAPLHPCPISHCIIRSMVPDAINLASVRRVLVTKLRHHGDVLLASPVFTVLRNRAPHAEIDALVYDDTRDMLEGHPAIAAIHGIDRAWKRQGLGVQARREGQLLSRLRERRYQLFVHLTNHWRGAWLAAALGPRWSVAQQHDSRVWNWCFTHRYPLPKARPRHTVEANLDALRRLGIYPEEGEKPLVMVPGEAAEARVEQLLAAAGLARKGFLHVHPTSRWLFKTW